MSYAKWIAEHYEHAKQVTAGTGIFPEVLLSQAIIESSKDGLMPNTELSKKYNNYFGIKAGKKYNGKAVTLSTGEFSPAGDYYKEPAAFRAYDNVKDSFADYVRVLKNKRYAAARAAGSVEEQANEIKKAGYSTAPNYASTLTALAQTIKSAAGSVVTAAKGSPVKSAALALTVAGALYLLTKQKANHGRG